MHELLNCNLFFLYMHLFCLYELCSILSLCPPLLLLLLLFSFLPANPDFHSCLLHFLRLTVPSSHAYFETSVCSALYSLVLFVSLPLPHFTRISIGFPLFLPFLHLFLHSMSQVFSLFSSLVRAAYFIYCWLDSSSSPLLCSLSPWYFCFMFKWRASDLDGGEGEKENPLTHFVIYSLFIPLFWFTCKVQKCPFHRLGGANCEHSQHTLSLSLSLSADWNV